MRLALTYMRDAINAYHKYTVDNAETLPPRKNPLYPVPVLPAPRWEATHH